jgi:hypothetical protein
MCRSPLSGAVLLRRLRKVGVRPASLGHVAAFENFDAIVGRLVKQMEGLARREPYFVVGHSLGGVLLRAAINRLPAGTPPPRHLFLLGSPVAPSRIAENLRCRLLFRLATGDCGQVLGSAERMAAVGPVSVPTTAIVGTRGLPAGLDPFHGEPNDGVVALSEASAPWISRVMEVPVLHTFLPYSAKVSDPIVRWAREQL